MGARYVLPLHLCTDARLVGGKASGLARLLALGLPVPPGCCVSTSAAQDAMASVGFTADAMWKQLLAASAADRQRMNPDVQRALDALRLPEPAIEELDQQIRSIEQDWPAGSIRWWAIRSSATDEDGGSLSQAGAYRTHLAVPPHELESAIRSVWASCWTPSALDRADGQARPLMAVIVQPLIPATSSGVAFSCHPLTAASDVVVINSVKGLADALVAGQVTPDSYLVEIPAAPGAPTIRQRTIAAPSFARIVDENGLATRAVPPSEPGVPSLSDEAAVDLARLVKRVEAGMGRAVDVEWAHDGTTVWLLQARPMTPQGRPRLFSDATSTWSRANFKETMPEVPTPLGLAFLEDFMEHGILRHYRQLGCRIPPDTSPVRVIAGRPYINVSLFQSFMTQLWGDPKQVTEQMGGEGAPLPYGPPPLPWWKVLRAGWLMERRIRDAARRAEHWFREMKAMALSGSAPQARPPIAVVQELHAINRSLRAQDLTFAIVGGVSQAFFVLERVIARRMGADWRSLLNASLQGSGSVISANQIGRLTALADTARREPAVGRFLLAEPWNPQSFRAALAGTQFLSDFDAYIDAYGHRALSESDVGSPRFADMPEYVLGVVRAQLQRPPSSTVPRDHGIAAARRAALEEIRRRFGWRLDGWALFRWWHRRLDRFLSLREANRHHLMYFSLAARRLELSLADSLVASGRLRDRNDVFLLRPEEIEALAQDAGFRVAELIERRRRERARWGAMPAPDVVRGVGELTLPQDERRESADGADGATLRGLPISTGMAEGPARVIRSPLDTAGVRRGDILVVSVIDPGLAPLFGLAAGLVAEMGGVLSHGAIIAREYGLPTVANVPGATHHFHDGERILVDGGRGEVRAVGQTPRGDTD